MKKVLYAAVVLAAFSFASDNAMALFGTDCDAKLVDKAVADCNAKKPDSKNIKEFKKCVHEGYVRDLTEGKPVKNKKFYDAATEALRETRGLMELVK